MKDGLQGVSIDRVLMRIKDFMSILMSLGAIVWGGYEGLRAIDRMNQSITILQQQVSSLQQLVTRR